MTKRFNTYQQFFERCGPLRIQIGIMGQESVTVEELFQHFFERTMWGEPVTDPSVHVTHLTAEQTNCDVVTGRVTGTAAEFTNILGEYKP